MSKGFAVDDECCSFIISHSFDTTASVRRRLALAATDKHLDQALHCYKAVKADKVLANKPNFVEGDSLQQTIDQFLASGITDPQMKKRLTMVGRLRNKKMELKGKMSERESDIEFISIFKKKSNRNDCNLPFKGIGRRKLLTLTDHGITTAQELLACDFDDNVSNKCVLPRWKRIVERHCENLDLEIDMLRSEIESVEREIDLHDCVNIFDMVEDDDTNDASLPTSLTPPTPPPRLLPPPFSDMMDKQKCNVRVVSKSTIDRITTSDHKQRAPVQEAKMRNISARILKIDWHCKLPSKIKVCTGRGKCFSPFRCGVTMQQEDALAVFWKCFPCSESIDMLAPDLKRLRARQRMLGSWIHVTHVDNCCSVREKLLRIFKGALVKLDTFHWMVRWDDILFDKNSEEASSFRHTLRRAVFVVENSEFNRVKHLHPSWSTQQMMKEAKATIPPADILMKRVQSCLNHFCVRDLETDMASVGNDGTERRRCLKSMTEKVGKGRGRTAVSKLTFN